MNKNKSDFYTIITASFAIGFLADVLFFKQEIGISFFIFTAAMLAIGLAILIKSGKKPDKIQLFFLISALILSADVFLRASSFLAFFNIIGALYLLVSAAIMAEKKNVFNSSLIGYFTAPILFTRDTLKNLAAYMSENKHLIINDEKFGSEKSRGIVKGVIMALPLLVLLGLFMYSADLVVQAYADKLFDFLSIKVNFDIVVRALIIFTVSFFMIGVFGRIASAKKSETQTANNPTARSIGFIESITVLSLMELMFLLFILIQFFYLFGGKNYVWGINEYITYSEYARKGFFELIAISLVSFLVIYTIDKTSKIEELKDKKIFKFLSATLFIEISVILLSALKRLMLYVDGYGLTLSRFLAFTLLLWVFSVFLLMLGKIFLRKDNSVFVIAVVAITAAIWIGVNALNPDSLIARTNIQRFEEGRKLDPFHFFDLSEDAIPEMIKIFKLGANDEIKERIAIGINWKYAYRDNCDIVPYNNEPYFASFGLSECTPILFSEKIKTKELSSSWQAYNLSKANSLKILKENAKEIDKYILSYWKKSAAQCKKNSIDCESICSENAPYDINGCKVTCGAEICERFEQKIKALE